MTRAEEEAAQGPETVNNERIAEAQKTNQAKAAEARREAKAAAGEAGAEEEEEEEGDVEIGEGDWERATEESLEKALKEAKESVTHARSYLIGELCRVEFCRVGCGLVLVLGRGAALRCAVLSLPSFLRETLCTWSMGRWCGGVDGSYRVHEVRCC